MPVGTGSIKRAAKLNANAEENTKKAAVNENAGAEKQEEAGAVKTAVKKTAAKSTAAQKTVTKKTTVKQPEQAASAEDSKTAATRPVGNQVCQLTEEMPVYLL